MLTSWGMQLSTVLKSILELHSMLISPLWRCWDKTGENAFQQQENYLLRKGLLHNTEKALIIAMKTKLFFVTCEMGTLCLSIDRYCFIDFHMYNVLCIYLWWGVLYPGWLLALWYEAVGIALPYWWINCLHCLSSFYIERNEILYLPKRALSNSEMFVHFH